MWDQAVIQFFLSNILRTTFLRDNCRMQAYNPEGVGRTGRVSVGVVGTVIFQNTLESALVILCFLMGYFFQKACSHFQIQ